MRTKASSTLREQDPAGAGRKSWGGLRNNAATLGFGGKLAAEAPPDFADVSVRLSYLALTITGMSFRTASGASFEGRDSFGNPTFRVSIPLDEEGYFGRECPMCHQVFRMHNEDYEALPDEQVLTCPYCGHREDHSEFMTKQQGDRVTRVAMDAANQMVSEILDKTFGSMARATRSNRFATVTYRSKPFFPEPLPGINEERLVRERTCPTCGVRYAVFGDHRFCPVSGLLDVTDIARDALAAETAKLDALNEIPEPQRSTLREQGVFDRVAVDTLGRVVGIVESLASAQFRGRVPEAENVLRGRGNVFQRLDDLDELFSAHLGAVLSTSKDVNWRSLKQLWAARHSHVHADGLVDAKYLKAAPWTSLKLGQRILVTEHDARTSIAQATALCAALASLPSEPPQPVVPHKVV